MQKEEIVKKFESGMKSLKKITDTQKVDGTWNKDEYNHGMVNGLILALSLFEENQPEFIQAPDKWSDGTPCRTEEE